MRRSWVFSSFSLPLHCENVTGAPSCHSQPAWLCLLASKGRDWAAGERRMMSSAATTFRLFMLLASLACTIRGATAGKRRKHCFDVYPKIYFKKLTEVLSQKTSSIHIGAKKHL